ncbi:putative RNA uridine N3 methyltransferase [Tardisphaera miroshnichenkoae]
MRNWPSELSIVIPDTSLSTHENPIDFTIRAGFLARYSAMANVHRIIIYREDVSKDARAGKDLETLLKFCVIPPYLRRRVFPLTNSLRYAGLIPPLSIPTHPQTKRIAPGDVRVAFIEDKKAVVDEEKLAELASVEGALVAPPGIKGLTFVKINSVKPLTAELCEPAAYSGFYVELTHQGLRATLAQLNGLKIGTSRYGDDYRKALPLALKQAAKGEVKETFLVFGSPSSDLSEILEAQGSSAKGAFDFYVNMDPGQVLKSIRTDEAVPLSLITLNCAAAFSSSGNPYLRWES